MNLVGLELSDAGIIATRHNTDRLLAVDGQMLESPGFAFFDKNKLLAGREAGEYAHITPDHFTNRFWDQLNTESIKIRGSRGMNHAEIACAHLEYIWKNIQGNDAEVIIAVPDFFDRNQLGIILGITKELSISTRGILPISLASARHPYPGLLLHLDIHLHRIAVAYLEQSNMLTPKDTFVSSGKGLDFLFGEWMKAISDVFVRSTRFDPLHNAASEQELYSKIPNLISSQHNGRSTFIEMTTGMDRHQVAISRDLLVKTSREVFQEVRQLIISCLNEYNKVTHPVTVLVSGRMSRLPGLLDMLTEIENIQCIPLADGTAACGALNMADQFNTVPQSGHGVAFLTKCPWDDSAVHHGESYSQKSSLEERQPTHILYQNIAYPITKTPLVISVNSSSQRVSITPVKSKIHELTAKECFVQFRDMDVVLECCDSLAIRVDETVVTGTTILSLGQNIIIGTSEEKLQLIACLDSDATKKN